MQKYLVKIFQFLAFFIFIPVYSQERVIPERPKLVIQLIIEQMRYDMIHRYRDKYSDKGFRRLIDEGTFCSNAYYDYMYTESAAGFATISTGANPSEHGIVSDYWYLRLTNKEQFCIDDSNLKTTSADFSGNKYSPRLLIGSTIGDELRLSNYKQSKVLGISLKNYAAILSSGYLANAAYWMDDKTGNWTSSSFYMDSLPKWVKEFNKKEFVKLYLEREWNTLNKISTYTESLSDNNSYETGFSNNKRTFPYKLSDVSVMDDPQVIKYTPFGNTYTLDFSIAAILNEKLGKDQFTDLITIDFSTPGFVNQQFGIHSIELEDIYLRLDNDIAHLLEFLDDEFKKENVLVILTSDRGAADHPEYLKEIGMPVGKFNPELAMSLTDSYLKATYGQSGWINHYSDGQVYLSQYLLDISKVPAGEIQLKAAQFINQFKGVAKSTTAAIMQATDSTSGTLQKFRNSFNLLRSGDIMICLEPGWLEEKNSKGNDYLRQSSPYRYDSHVPLLFYGWKITRKEILDPIPINNVATTIANFLDISYPSGASGKAINGL